MGVTGQVATPLAFVVAVHDRVPFSVSVTGSFGTGWFVYVLTSVPVIVVEPL